MSENERNQKYQQQTQEIYAAIGKFAVKFEQVMFNLQSGIIFLFHKDGLKNQSLIHALLANMTADPICKAWLSVILETDKTLSEKDKKIISNIKNRLKQLIEIRNNVVHRMMFVGWAAPTDEDFSVTSSIKAKNTAAGVVHMSESFTAADFDKYSYEADQLAEIVTRLSHIVLDNRQIEKNFALDNNVVKIIYSE